MERDTEPKICPSPQVAKNLLQRLEEVSKGVKSRNVVTQLSFVRDKTKKLENQVSRLKERNNEKEMSILMHQIHHDGKSLSDFEPSDLKCLLGYVKQKLNEVRMRTNHFKQVLPPNPPPPPPPVSCPQENEVLEKQSSLDLVKEVDQLNSGFDNDNNIGSSSMGLPPPHANLSNVYMVLPQENFGGFNNVSDLGVFPPRNFGDLIGESDLGSEVFSPSDFGGLISESDSGLGAFRLENFGGLIGESDEGNFEGLNGESDEGNFEGLNVGSDSGVLPQDNGDLGMLLEGLNDVWPEGNFGDLNDESDLLEMYNFEGLNGESGDSSQVFPEGNFGDLNDGSDLLKMLFEGNFEGLNGESNSGLLNGSSIDEIGGNNIWPSYGHFESTIDGSYMEKEQLNENQGGFINNSGANTQEAAMGRFDVNFVGNNNGNNLNFGLPTNGNFASSGEFGSDTQVSTSFRGNFP
ncbi:hypothetical protein SESBI_47217 [Sesbania bispinosa]|nr:hypothetical protein SESBI_47217 [Sesbania bispinosa]